MISKDMYRFLKRIPRWPRNKTFAQIDKMPFMDRFLRLGLLIEAKQRGFIGCNGKEEDNTAGFFLEEQGKEAVEEYKRQKGADVKATWALVLAAMSLGVSIVALFVS